MLIEINTGAKFLGAILISPVIWFLIAATTAALNSPIGGWKDKKKNDNVFEVSSFVAFFITLALWGLNLLF